MPEKKLSRQGESQIENHWHSSRNALTATPRDPHHLYDELTLLFGLCQARCIRTHFPYFM